MWSQAPSLDRSFGREHGLPQRVHGLPRPWSRTACRGPGAAVIGGQSQCASSLLLPPPFAPCPPAAPLPHTAPMGGRSRSGDGSALCRGRVRVPGRGR